MKTVTVTVQIADKSPTVVRTADLDGVDVNDPAHLAAAFAETVKQAVLDGVGVLSDAQALDLIAQQMSGRDWNADTLDVVANLVRTTGRVVLGSEDVDDDDDDAADAAAKLSRPALIEAAREAEALNETPGVRGYVVVDCHDSVDVVGPYPTRDAADAARERYIERHNPDDDGQGVTVEPILSPI